MNICIVCTLPSNNPMQKLIIAYDFHTYENLEKKEKEQNWPQSDATSDQHIYLQLPAVPAQITASSFQTSASKCCRLRRLIQLHVRMRSCILEQCIATARARDKFPNHRRGFSSLLPFASGEPKTMPRVKRLFTRTFSYVASLTWTAPAERSC